MRAEYLEDCEFYQQLHEQPAIVFEVAMKHTCFCSLKLFLLNYCFCALGQGSGREHYNSRHQQKELLRESNREMNF